MFLTKHIALLFLWISFSAANAATSHIIIKQDFDHDGKADRVVFASHGISGFFQSQSKTKKIDTFFISQGNRSILFITSKELGAPHVKLVENTGLFKLVTIMRYENKSFKHVNTYVLPEKTYFSNDPFATESDPFAPIKKEDTCTSNTAFNNQPITQALSWSQALDKYSLKDTVEKAINPNCKEVLGSDYQKFEEQILGACGVTTSSNDKYNLVNCLDKNSETKLTGGLYTTSLAANIFGDGFKISCEKLSKSTPVASLTGNNITIYQTTPAQKNRNFKADYFHEMMHASGIDSEEDVGGLVSKCLLQNKAENGQHIYLSNQDKDIAILNNKDGKTVNLPSTQPKEVPATAVAAAMNEGSKALDSDFSTENSGQYATLSQVSKATFKSFDPIMKAAYEAAVPTAFAQNTVSQTTISASSAPITVSKTASSRTIASADNSDGIASYSVASLPENTSSANGELGNGLAVKATTVSAKAAQPRNPASSGAGSETGTSDSSSSGSGAGGAAGSIGYKPTTDRPDLRNNVPQLKAEEDFVKTLTTGKYEDVKARLTDPKNQKILEDKRIQYVARDRTLGSKQPVMILKDLGNKFSVVRVTIE